jgi:glycerol-3-phosphate dehydrogenase
VNHVFRREIAPAEVVWTYSGVRPLYDDGASDAQAATRDYVLKLDGANGAAPLINVFGGKITTYRRLAEAALEKIEEALGEKRGRPWTAGATLPGGYFPIDGYDALVSDLAHRHPALPHALLARLARAYGTDAQTILADVEVPADMGRDFGAGLTAREVEWLRTREWAISADDILWRRSKLGLRLSAAEVAALEESLAGNRAPVAASAIAG